MRKLVKYAVIGIVAVIVFYTIYNAYVTSRVAGSA